MMDTDVARSPVSHEELERLLQLAHMERMAERNRLADLARQNELLRRDLLLVNEEHDIISQRLAQTEMVLGEIKKDRDRLESLRTELTEAVAAIDNSWRAAVDQCDMLQQEIKLSRVPRLCSPPAVRFPDYVKYRTEPSIIRRAVAYVILRYAKIAARNARLVEAEVLYQALIIFRPRAFLFRQTALMLEQQGYMESASLVFRDALALDPSDETARQGLSRTEDPVVLNICASD